jgi:hypothetical protein
VCTHATHTHTKEMEKSLNLCAESALQWCCASCLRGETDTSYYEVLQLIPASTQSATANTQASTAPSSSSSSPSTRASTRHITSDEIKRAYKRISLSIHPDKLTQRGLEVTLERRQQFVTVKEAYDVLSDPRKRKLYDAFGKTGLQMVESPAEVNPLDLLKNFQVCWDMMYLCVYVHICVCVRVCFVDVFVFVV